MYLVIAGLVSAFQSTVGFQITSRLISDLGGCVLLLALSYFIHQHKEHIRAMVSKWTPLEFPGPVCVLTGIKDSGGEIRQCRFEVGMTLWFADEHSAAEAIKTQDKIHNAMQLFLEEAAHDPVLRRSRGYLNDWINDSYKMPDLQRIDVQSLTFSPIHYGADTQDRHPQPVAVTAH
ncbi:MAG: hypothetical protein O2985_08020 [Proteobacteria bacterium]|nr:hypothetical protein [Pseudomonadota bacterium]